MKLSLETATLSCHSEPVSVQFHPSEQAVCVGCIDGTVQFYEWKESSEPSEGFLELVEGWEELADDEGGDENVRAVAFISGGEKVACGTSSGCITLYDSSSGSTCDEVTAEGDVYSLLAVGGGSKVLAAGHEDGVVSLWDVRKKGLAEKLQFDEQSDYISDMCYNTNTESLVSTCGDGTLAVYDLRKGKFMERSDDTADDDMLCCTMAKGCSKIVVGSQEGVVNLFSWGHFEDCSDRYPTGHPDSIDCMVSYSDSQVITGCGDGIVRLVSVLPNRILAEVGRVEEGGNVHCVALSCDNAVLAAGSDTLRLWRTRDLEEQLEGQDEGEQDDEDDDEDEQGSDSSDEEERPAKKLKKAKKDSKKGKKSSGSKRNSNCTAGGFFSGLL